MLVDDAANSVADSYGLSHFPFTVFVDASGQVVGRVTGAIPVETFVIALEQLAER